MCFYVKTLVIKILSTLLTLQRVFSAVTWFLQSHTKFRDWQGGHSSKFISEAKITTDVVTCQVYGTGETSSQVS